MRPTLFLLAGLAACASVPDDFDTFSGIDTPLVATQGAVAGSDGLYVPMPYTGQVVRLTATTDEVVPVDLGARRILRLMTAPDGQVLARTLGYRCESDEPGPFLTVDDCPETPVPETFLELLDGDESAQRWPAGLWYDAPLFSDDSRWAVSAIDPDADTKGAGLVNQTSLLMIDLQDGRRFEIPVGVNADRVLFIENAGATTTGAIVLSRSAVARLDLSGERPEVVTTYPLTLDSDATLTPNDVVLTPDARFALISIVGSSDLYVLNLESPGINIVSLAGVPSAMVVDSASDQTVITYSNESAVEVLDHDLFDVRRADLDEPANHIQLLPGYAMLSALGTGRDVVRLDLDTLVTDEIRLTYIPDRLIMAPGDQMAVTIVRNSGEGSNLEILDLRPRDNGLKQTSTPFRLDGPAVGLAVDVTDDGVSVLVLQEGVDTLFELSWPALELSEVPLDAPPAAIGRLPDGGFYIGHDVALGRVSFYDPGSDIVSVGGFGHLGLLDRPRLLPEEE